MQITKDTLIMEVLAKYPKARAVFLQLGLGCLECLGASHETLEAGACMHGLPVETLLAALGAVIEPAAPAAQAPQQQE